MQINTTNMSLRAKIGLVVGLLTIVPVGFFISGKEVESPLVQCNNSYIASVKLIEEENEKAKNTCISSGGTIDTLISCMQNVRKDYPENTCSTDMTKLSNSGTASPTPVSGVAKHTETTGNKSVEGQESKKVLTIRFLKTKVCKRQPQSPLCTEEGLMERLYDITEERIPNKNFFPILIGITNAESSLGINFAKDRVGGTCYGRNNWGGAKYLINDDNSRVFARTTNGFVYDMKTKTDQYGCWLFPFENYEEYWKSKVNGMRFGYKGCINSINPVRCISYAYVGNPNVAEQSWIDNVSSFLP